MAGRRRDERPVMGRVLPYAKAKQRIVRGDRRTHDQIVPGPKKELSRERNVSAMARAMGVSRASLYYVPLKERKDWALKVRMEEELHAHPSYGSRRLADALGVN